MGFLSSATTITVTAKLTKNGRDKLLQQSTSNIFTHFILGDSDANYQTSGGLTSGKVLSNSGNLGEGGTVNDNIAQGITIHSKLYKGAQSTFTKKVESGSNVLSDTIVSLGETVVSGDNLTYILIDRNNHTSEFSNLFKSLNLPITVNEVGTFSATAANGGWLDTAFSGFSSDRVLLGIINNDSYGELIDGKSIRTFLPVYTGFTAGGSPTGLTTFDIYSTFPKTSQYSKTQLDNQYEDLSQIASGLFGPNPNVTYLVNDNIQPPNDDNTKSWATGYDTFKPFTINNKELLNPSTPPGNPNIVKDIAIGFASLDKGVVVITDPNIVDNVAVDFSGDPTTTTTTNSLGLYSYTGGTYNTTVDSILNNIVQNVVCIAGKNEFYRSSNTTIDNGFDNVRISEIAVVANGNPNDVLAIGKIDRQIIKLQNEFIVFNVQIVI